MNNEQIITLYRGVFNPLEMQSFQFSINKRFTQLKGILVSNDTSLVLSLNSETDLQINAFEYAYRDEQQLPPSKRVFEINQPLNCLETIKGTVRNLKTVHEKGTPRTISIYLILS